MKLSMTVRVGLYLLLMWSAGARAAEPTRLNLLAIVTDDQAAWTLGCYGGHEVATPNLDRLAARGARFENAFVHTPVCSPSRGTYLTGLLGTQLGITDWLNDGQSETQGITKDTPTWPAILAKNGYATCMVGKWHVGHRDASLPWNNGIGQYIGNLGGGWQPDHVKFVDEKGGTHSPTGFSVEICADYAMKFMDEHAKEPFALLVHFREPHAPYVPMPAPDMKTSREAALKTPDYPGLKQPYTDNHRRDYLAAIAAVDRNVGRMLDHLEKAGLADRTVVVFTSDHGYNVGEHGIQHKGNGFWITTENFQKPRPNMFDTSLRIPLLIRHPAGKPGVVVPEWISNRDFFATYLGLLDVPRPAHGGMASRDVSAAVRGEALPAEKFPHEHFGQYDLVNNPTKRSMRMIRTDRWKLIRHLNAPEQNELYDLTADPGERTNLFARAELSETIKDLDGRLLRQMRMINDPKTAEVARLQELK